MMVRALWHPFEWIDDQLEKLSAFALSLAAVGGFSLWAYNRQAAEG